MITHWLLEHIELILTVIGSVCSAYAYVRFIIIKKFQLWISINYIPRNEIIELVEKSLQSVNDKITTNQRNTDIRFNDMSQDIVNSAEAGMKLSEQINTQVQSLLTSLLTQKRGNNND